MLDPTITPPTPASPVPSGPSFKPRTLLVLGALTVAAAVAVVFMIMRGGQKDEAVIALVERPAPTNQVNTSAVVDTSSRRDAKVELGHRYKVIIDDESRDTAAGVAHIGGLVTFVPGTRRGDEVVIEITRLKRSTAEAVVVEKIGEGRPVSGPPSRREAPALAAASSGPIHTGVVESVGKKGDGIIKVKGKVVFVPGVQAGDEVVFQIVEDRDNHAVGRVLSKQEASLAPASSSTAASAAPAAGGAVAVSENKADLAQPGAVFDVKVDAESREKPGQEGVAHIEGLVVFVPGTHPGDQVRIRITKRGARFAVGEVIPGAPSAAPSP